MDGAATLLDQGIDADAVSKLIENGADLGDIAINAQILLDGGIRLDLVNEWLSNKDTIEKPRSPNYNPIAINDTHIPIQAP